MYKKKSSKPEIHLIFSDTLFNYPFYVDIFIENPVTQMYYFIGRNI
jgi:hypothetical protein